MYKITYIFLFPSHAFRQEWENVRNATTRVRRQLAATGDGSRISEATCRAEVSYGQVQNAEALVTLYEVMLGITQTWTEESAEYKQYYKENVETTFRKSIDELERLVVMRISEVGKLNEPGLGACDSNPLLPYLYLKHLIYIRCQPPRAYCQSCESPIGNITKGN